jgi:5-methyltetrahydropteroyltriglutamate--homocysteine methyltransferase
MGTRPGRADERHQGSPYRDPDEFLADVVRIQRRIAEELLRAGCRYVQLDEPSYTGYVDPATLARMRAAATIRSPTSRARWTPTMRSSPAWKGATFGLHVCRGNRASMWHREGSYDAIAERLFGGLRFDRLLLEYDTARAGGFEPLRFVPKASRWCSGSSREDRGIEDPATSSSESGEWPLGSSRWSSSR